MSAQVVPIHPPSHTTTTVPLVVPGSVEHHVSPYISASKVAALYGAHPFLTTADLAAMKRGEYDDPAGEAAATGEWLEASIAQWWADKHGAEVVKPSVNYVYGPLAAAPDRLIVGAPDVILEIKASTKEEGVVAPYWWMQVQAQMCCTGANMAILAVLWGGSLTRREYHVARDEPFILDMIDRAETFLAYIDEGLEPPPAAIRDPAEGTVEVCERVAEKLADLAAVNAAKTELEKQAKTLRGELLAEVGAAGLEVGSRVALTCGGKPVAKVRVQRGREQTVGTGSFGEPFAVLDVKGST